MAAVVPQALLPLVWGTSRAARSLAVASAAWMLSGLTASPLVNGLLPAAAALPLLVVNAALPRLGITLQTLATGLLLAAAAGLMPEPVLATLIGVLLLSLGAQLVDAPLLSWLAASAELPRHVLRFATEAGRLTGTALAGLLFPIGRALLQFSQVVVLLLPLAVLLTWLAPLPTTQAAEPGAEGCLSRSRSGPFSGFSAAPLLQGLLFGALFGLIPLWVRRQGAGNCFDFAMVLSAYGVGRAAGEAFHDRLQPGATLAYPLLAAILAGTQVLPGWAAVLLFLPLGLIAAGTDQQLQRNAQPEGEGNLQGQRLGRSICLGGLGGSLVMGLAGQRLGLAALLPIQVLAFLGAAVLMPRLCRLR